MSRCPKCSADLPQEAQTCTRCGANLAAGALGAATLEFRTDPAMRATVTVPPDHNPQAIAVGKVIAGRYEIVCQLGVGGMGEVWKALDREMDGLPVALKVLPVILTRFKGGVEVLKREAAISLRLTHPSICRLHTFHTDGPLKFLVMEYVDGQTLEDYLDARASRKLSIEELLPVASDIAEALDHAHGLRPAILHRDVKPANIMVMRDGRAKVLDFGIAREMRDSMTRITGQETSGTLLYMSPEQFVGKTPSASSDVYSLAATCYECLCGHPPFWQGSIAHQLLHTQPADIPGLPPYVNAALRAGLSKNAEERPATGAEFVAMLAGTVSAPRPRTAAAATMPVMTSEPTVIAPAPSRKTTQKVTPKTAAAPRARSVVAWRLAIVFCLMGSAAAIYLIGSRMGTSRNGTGDQSATLKELEPIRLRVEKAWESAKAIERGPGFGQLIDEAANLHAQAVEAFSENRPTEAMAAYEQLGRRCASLMELRQRQQDAAAARAEVQGAAGRLTLDVREDAPTLVEEAAGLDREAITLFEEGRYEDARLRWQLAVARYGKAREHSAAIVELRAAEKAFREVVAVAGEEKLRRHGGAEWSAVEDAVREARLMGADPKKAAAAYARARELFPAAVQAAADREQAAVAAELAAAEKTFHEALAAADELKLRAHGGEAWRAVDAVLREAQAATDSSRRADAYRRARNLLPDAIVVADRNGLAAALAAARAAFTDALKAADATKLKQHGGKAWAIVEEALRDAESPKTDPKAAIAAYDKARSFLPAAILAADEAEIAAHLKASDKPVVKDPPPKLPLRPGNPKPAARIFLTAVMNGDAKVAAATSIPGNARQQESLDTLVSLCGGYVQVRSALRSRFGVDIDEVLPGAMKSAKFEDLLEDTLQSIDDADVTFDGDTASIELDGDDEPLVLRRVNGQWKVDLSSMDALNGLELKELKLVATVLSTVADNLRANRYRDVREIQLDMINIVRQYAPPPPKGH